MDKEISAVSSAYSAVISSLRKFQLLGTTAEALEKGKLLEEAGATFLATLKGCARSVETALADCQFQIKEMNEELRTPRPVGPYVFNTVNGALSYQGLDYLTPELKVEPAKREPAKPEPAKLEPSPRISRVFIKEINSFTRAIEVSDLHQIPSMFHYYNNPDDKKNGPGLYCCLAAGVYVKMAFPVVVNSKARDSRDRSIRCKYGPKEACEQARQQKARDHRSAVRACNYAHKGENLVRVGYNSRCDPVPWFGNPQTLMRDLPSLGKEEIRTILMYGLNDLFSAGIWLEQKKIRNVVVSHLDVA
jgi:hypothetical protein